MLANCRSQFLLDRLGRCLKLFASTLGPSSHDVASQFGLAQFFLREKHPKTHGNRVARVSVYLTHRKGSVTASRLVARDPSNSDNLNGGNCGHSGDRLSQNGEKAKYLIITYNYINSIMHLIVEHGTMRRDNMSGYTPAICMRYIWRHIS